MPLALPSWWCAESKFCLHWTTSHSCTTAQPQAPHFPVFPNKEPSAATLHLKPFDFQTSALGLYRLSHLHPEIFFVPLTSNNFHKVIARLYSFAISILSLMFSPFAPISWKLPEDLASLRAILDSGRVCALLYLPPSDKLDTDWHQTIQYRKIFPKDLPGHISTLFSPFLPYFLWQKSQPGSSHAPSFNSSCSCLAAHFFQYTERALCTSIFSTSFAHTKPHVNLCVIAEDQRVPVWPFYAQITGLTHHFSCGSFHLFPRFNLSNLPHPNLFLLVTPFSCQHWVAMEESSSSTSRAYVSINKDNEVVLVLPAASFNFNLSVGDIPTAWTLQVLAGIIPARNKFLTPTIM